MIDLELICRRMENNAVAIDALCSGVEPEAARWRRLDGKWSLQDILCHLVDEESDDFGARVRSTLEDPQAEWTGIDPEGWVLERGYAQRDFQEMRKEFQTRRAASLEWLRAQGDADWSRAYVHPKLGTLRAGDLLLAWLVHDQLHIRQLSQWHADYFVAHEKPFHADYALP